MTATARDILDQRLARGEIDEQEHERLLARLAKGQQAPEPAPPGESTNTEQATTAAPPSRAAIANNIFGIVSLLVLAIFAFVGAKAYYHRQVDGTFDIGSIQGSAGGGITYSISNRNQQSGDVLVYVTQQDLRLCEHIVRMNAGARLDVRFGCPQLRAGRIQLVAAWASSQPRIASVAQRVQ